MATQTIVTPSNVYLDQYFIPATLGFVQLEKRPNGSIYGFKNGVWYIFDPALGQSNQEAAWIPTAAASEGGPMPKILRSAPPSSSSFDQEPDPDTTSSGVLDLPDVPTRVYVGLAIFIILSGGLFWYWFAFPCINSVFPEFYPRLGSELPGPYFSTLYGDNWDWWIFAITLWNALPPMVLALAVVHRGLREYTFAHSFICIWALIENLFVIVVGGIRWLGWCNNSWSAPATACNDYAYCCVYWPSEWCPNNGPCTFSSGLLIGAGDLHRNNEMTQTWAFAFVFFLMAVWHLKLNYSLRRNWGLLK